MRGQSRKNTTRKQLLIKSIKKKLREKKEPSVKKARMKINFDDTTTLCDEFSKTLNFIYFAENEYIETCYINFNI